MSAVTIHGYGKFIARMLNGTIGSLSDVSNVVRCALMHENLTLNQEHEYWEEVSTHEVSGDWDPEGHYSPIDLNNKQVQFVIADDKVYFKADNISYGQEVTITARYMVIYLVRETPSVSPLMLFVDLGDIRSSLDGRFDIQWHTDGIFSISV